MAAPEPTRTFRRIRVLPRRAVSTGKAERSLPEPPSREPERQLSVVLPLSRGTENPLPTLLAAQPLRAAGHEVVLVHEALSQPSLELVAGLVDQIVESEGPPARQMNLGARHAWGEQLLFLRVGCLLPEHAAQGVLEALEMETSSQWGGFTVRFTGSRFHNWFAGQPANLRSRLLGIVSDTQGIFMRRSLFEEVGGFPGVSSQEAVAVSRHLRRGGFPVILDAPWVITVAR